MSGESEIRAKKYLFVGIPLGALFGFVGSFLVTVMFRVIDKLGETSLETELFYLTVALFVFFGLLLVFYLILCDLDKKEERKNMNLKLALKRSRPFIWFLFLIIFFTLFELFVINSSSTGSLFAQILGLWGILFMTLWGLAERSKFAQDIIATIVNPLIAEGGNHWMAFQKFCAITGAGLASAGFIILIRLSLN